MESLDKAVEVEKEGEGAELRTTVRYKGPEMRPYIRFLTAKELYKHLCRSEHPIAAQFKDAPEDVLEIQGNIFAGMLLVPGKFLKEEVEKIDSSLDIVMQLSEIFWSSKALMNLRLKDYLENFN